MKLPPPNVRFQHILCPTCLCGARAQGTWFDPQDLTLVCPVHDAVLTVQTVGDLTGPGLLWK